MKLTSIRYIIAACLLYSLASCKVIAAELAPTRKASKASESARSKSNKVSPNVIPDYSTYNLKALLKQQKHVNKQLQETIEKLAPLQAKRRSTIKNFDRANTEQQQTAATETVGVKQKMTTRKTGSNYPAASHRRSSTSCGRSVEMHASNIEKLVAEAKPLQEKIKRLTQNLEALKVAIANKHEEQKKQDRSHKALNFFANLCS